MIVKFNNKIILLTLFTLTSCNPNLNDSDSFEKSKLIPEEVLNANVEIDILFDKRHKLEKHIAISPKI